MPFTSVRGHLRSPSIKTPPFSCLSTSMESSWEITKQHKVLEVLPVDFTAFLTKASREVSKWPMQITSSKYIIFNLQKKKLFPLLILQQPLSSDCWVRPASCEFYTIVFSHVYFPFKDQKLRELRIKMVQTQNKNTLNKILFPCCGYFSIGENKTEFYYLAHLFIIQFSSSKWVPNIHNFPHILREECLCNSLPSF